LSAPPPHPQNLDLLILNELDFVGNPGDRSASDFAAHRC
jgi:hypothetical protein